MRIRYLAIPNNQQMLKKKKVLATIYYGKESLVIEILKNSFYLLLQFLLLSKTLKSRPNPHQNRGTGTDKQTQEAEGRKRPKNYRFVFVRFCLVLPSSKKFIITSPFIIHKGTQDFHYFDLDL